MPTPCSPLKADSKTTVGPKSSIGEIAAPRPLDQNIWDAPILRRPEARDSPQMPSVSLRPMRRATREVLYDQMKTAVLREDADVPAVYNPSLVALLGPLRISAEGLQSLSGEDQWQVGAPVPLHPQGLLPGSDLSELGRFQRPVRKVARRDRQSVRPRHDRPDRRRNARRRTLRFDRSARATTRMGQAAAQQI